MLRAQFELACIALAMLCACSRQPGASLNRGSDGNTPANTSSAPEFTDSEQASRWTTYYYERPDPDRVPAAYHAFVKYVLSRPNQNDGADWTLTAFFAEIAQRNPGRIDGWTRELASLPPADLHCWWNALSMSGTSEGREQITSFADRATGPEQDRAHKLLRDRTPPVLDWPASHPMVLDMWWSGFFATGDERYIQKFIPLLVEPQKPAPKEDGKVDAGPIVIHGAAAWSVRANAFQHRRVLEICRSEMEKRTGAERDELRKIVEQTDERLKKEPSPDPGAGAPRH